MVKNKFWQYLVCAIAVTLLLPSVASAHTGVGDPSGFWHGIQHPIGGLDHILAMVAVGLWAAQMGGTALWMVPGAFVVAMAGSSILGHFGLPLPGIEQGILASDFLLSLLILFAARFPLAISMGLVSILAIFHGYAHGAEMPATSSGLTYGIGFILSTAALHLVGIGLGLAITTNTKESNNLKLSALRDRLFQVGGAAVLLGAVYVSVN